MKTRLLASAILHMIETDDKNWIIAKGNKVLTIRPDGRVQNVIQKEYEIDRRFQNLCCDNYGNIFTMFTHCESMNMFAVTVSDILLLNSDE